MNFQFQKIHFKNQINPGQTQILREQTYLRDTNQIKLNAFNKSKPIKNDWKNYKITNLKNNLRMFQRRSSEEYIQSIRNRIIPNFIPKNEFKSININGLKVSQEFIFSLFEIVKMCRKPTNMNRSPSKSQQEYKLLLEKIKQSNIQLDNQNVYVVLLEFIQKQMQNNLYKRYYIDQEKVDQEQEQKLENKNSKTIQLKNRMKIEKVSGLLDYMSNQSIFQQKDTIQLLKKTLYLDYSNFSEGARDQQGPTLTFQTFTVEDFQKSIDSLDFEEYIQEDIQQLQGQKKQKIQLLMSWNKQLQKLIQRI